jgi:hypothetical protein
MEGWRQILSYRTEPEDGIESLLHSFEPAYNVSIHGIGEGDDLVVAVSNNNLYMDLEWIGEGWNGDYDANDPNDKKLLRFTFQEYDEDGNAVPLEDCSYCTRLALGKSTLVSLIQIAVALFKRVESEYPGGNIKRICENLSWLSNEYD